MKIINLTVILVFVATLFGFAQQNVFHQEESMIIEQLNQRTQSMMDKLSENNSEYFILQSGINNHAAVVQEIQPDVSAARINIFQLGHSNSIDYFDSGANNYLNLNQKGFFNSTELITDGKLSLFNISQSGSKNLVWGVLQGDNMAQYNVEQDNQSNNLLIIDDRSNKINGLDIKMTGNMTMIIRNGF